MACHLAIAGVTGAVGQEFLSILEERDFPFDTLTMLASSRSKGKKIPFKGKEYTVKELTKDSFTGVDVVLFSAGGSRSKEFGPAAAQAGAVVVDNSSAFRMDPEVPLVVPEINAEAIKTHKGIIANPNCSTIIGIVPVWPLHQANPVKRMIVSTYQAASGAGAAAMQELETQSREILDGKEPTCNAFPCPIAFNCFNHNSALAPNGYNEEEMKLVKEMVASDLLVSRYRDHGHVRANPRDAGPLREHQSGVHRSDDTRPGEGSAQHRAGRDGDGRSREQSLPDADRRLGQGRHPGRPRSPGRVGCRQSRHQHLGGGRSAA